MSELPRAPSAPPTSPDYDRLSVADKALVDRAIFDHVVTQQGGGFQFSSDELRLRGGRAPNSQQVDWDIKALREQHADLLVSGGAAARQQLTREGQGAPANATGMLNAIVAFNGDECGCTLTPPRAINVNQVLQASGRNR